MSHHLLWTWHNPTEKSDSSGICLKISSVTKWTPRCCGRKLILRWNHAEPICRPEPLTPPPRWFDDSIVLLDEELRMFELRLALFLMLLLPAAAAAAAVADFDVLWGGWLLLLMLRRSLRPRVDDDVVALAAVMFVAVVVVAMAALNCVE